MADILVVGGAGYIGSHMCKLLHLNDHTPIVLDNLAHGHREAVRWGPLFEGSITWKELLGSIFSEYDVKVVMHFASYCYVGESMTDPGKYYENNVGGTVCLLRSMVEHGISNLIFSSSCATYGEPVEIPISETHPQNPISPYGRTKLMVEQILDDFEKAHGLESVSLRYFNAVGADPEGEIGEDHDPETHLIPLLLQTALGQREYIEVFGDDYGTKDGTCIRDYIHVNDIAQAHLLAMDRLMGGKGSGRYNLGNGRGYSVREVLEVAREVTGEKIPVRIASRREGDPAVLISAGLKAAEELGWEPRLNDLETMVATAWAWQRANSKGYERR